MHTTLIATILLCVFVAVSSRLINDDAEIARLNALNAGWEAGHNARFADMTHEQAGRLLGLAEVPREVSAAEARDVSAAQGLPTNYDSRTVYPQCVMPIKDQGACGACWAFAGSSMLGMRMCIQSNGAAKVDMSPQASINCNTANNGCNGGTLGNTWEFFVNSGSVAESSVPFTGKKTTCSISSGVRRYKASTYSRPNTVAAMQQAIYNDGAIQVGLDIYSDFYNYKSGVYRRTSNSLAGGHSVYLVGWGTLNGVDYWIGINSWSQSFGNKGAFMIQRGVNMCNIEKGYLPVAGTVAASSIPTGTTTTTRAPTTTTKAPTTTTRAPTTTTRAPTTTTRAPTTTTRAPTTTTTTRAPTTTTTTKAPTTTTTTRAPTTTTTTRAPTTTTTTRAPTTTTTTKAPTTTTTRASSTTTTTRAPSTTTTTRAPTTTTTKAPVYNCWTCGPGFVHWYDVVGMAQPADKCACVPAPATTKAPATTTKAPTTTTKAPATTTKAPTTTTKAPTTLATTTKAASTTRAATQTKSATETLATTTTSTEQPREASEEPTEDTEAPSKQETVPYTTVSTDAPSSEAPTNGDLTEAPQKLTTNASGSLAASLVLVIACIMFNL